LKLAEECTCADCRHFLGKYYDAQKMIEDPDVPNVARVWNEQNMNYYMKQLRMIHEDEDV